MKNKNLLAISLASIFSLFLIGCENYTDKKFIIKNTTITLEQWEKVGFDNVAQISAFIVNASDHDVKDVQITCDYYSNSGTKIDKNEKTIFEVVPARQFLVIDKFNIGLINSQATKSKCFVSNLVVLGKTKEGQLLYTVKINLSKILLQGNPPFSFEGVASFKVKNLETLINIASNRKNIEMQLKNQMALSVHKGPTDEVSINNYLVSSTKDWLKNEFDAEYLQFENLRID